MKVGFQAGVLQVWLDEAGLTFDHADGASGGCFNLAMYCQGMSGKQIADNWRTLDPFLPVDLNLEHYWRLAARSVALHLRQLPRPRAAVLGHRLARGSAAATRLGTFNVLNFSEEARGRSQQRDDRGPVHRRGVAADVVSAGRDRWRHLHRLGLHHRRQCRGGDPPRRRRDLGDLDGQHASDEWRGGFVAQYFHIIEADRRHPLLHDLEAHRARTTGDRGRWQPGEFGRRIELKLLQAEVPVHYLFNSVAGPHGRSGQPRRQDGARVVPAKRRGPDPSGRELRAESEAPPPRTKLQFTEEMKGYAAAGSGDPAEGAKKGKDADTKLDVHLTINVDDVDRFITEPDHPASANG